MAREWWRRLRSGFNRSSMFDSATRTLDEKEADGFHATLPPGFPIANPTLPEDEGSDQP